MSAAIASAKIKFPKALSGCGSGLFIILIKNITPFGEQPGIPRLAWPKTTTKA